MGAIIGVVAVVVLIPCIWFIATYNVLIRLRNHVRESWSGIDTELKRRYDLIPNLVETVKGYAQHERELLERVTEARNRAAASTGSPASQASDENAFVGTLRSLFAVVENYPDLKASQNFLKLQEELADKTVESSSGGGMVKVTANGRQQIVAIQIENEVVDPDDVEMLQDLVMAAVNDALAKSQEMVSSEMGKLTGGLNIPGLT